MDDKKTLESVLRKEEAKEMPPTVATSHFDRQLNESVNEIRLLELLPVRDDFQIKGEPQVQCRIRYSSFDDNEDFTALSYVWGDPNQTLPILVDGYVVQVTENLEAALRQLQSDKILTLWVDALCINQKNHREKNHQVQNMRFIYQRATQVLAWLGVAQDDSDIAIEHLKELGRAAQSHGIHYASSVYIPSEMEKCERFVVDAIKKKMIPGKIHVHAIMELCKRPWWRRVWVIQEVALAKSAIIICGVQSIPWLEICAAFGFFHVASRIEKAKKILTAELYARLRFCKSATRTMMRIYSEIRHSHEMSEIGSIFNYSCVRTTLQASDPRDRLFGLLGLLKESYRIRIRVDYSLTCKEVFLQAAELLLERYGLKTLSWCVRTPSECEFDLPSWVPDWASRITGPIISPYYTSGNRYSPSGNHTIHSAGIQVSRADLILSMNGIWVDTIESIGPIWMAGVPRRDHKFPTIFEKWINEARVLLSPKNEVYRSPSEVEEALWRTPIIDYSLIGYSRAGKEEELSYQILIGAQKPSRRFNGDPMGWRVEHSNRYTASLKMFKRRVFVSEKGYLGLGCASVQPGDRVCILLGAQSLFVLRRGENGQYQLISDSYVHGIMDGEFMKQDLKTERIELY